MIQRLAEDKRNLIDLSQSFEYLRDLELEKASAEATNRPRNKEQAFKTNYGSQRKRPPENLNEMIKLYESRISRLKEV